MNPYEVLGLSENASAKEIKSAYRRMAKRFHPDTHPGDEKAALQMNRVNAAYAMLRELEKNPGAGPEAFSWDDEEGFRSEPFKARRQSIFYRPLFRRCVLLILAASMLLTALFAAFYSALAPF